MIFVLLTVAMVARTGEQTREIPVLEEKADVEMSNRTDTINPSADLSQTETPSVPEEENHAAYPLQINHQNTPTVPKFSAKLYATDAKTSTKIVRPNHHAPDLLPVVDQEDILLKHRILADRVLRALPSGCRDNLRQFYVTYEQNPKYRGLGGASTIIVTGTVSDDEFMALIVHECGHVADLGGMRGSPDGGPTTFVDGNTPMYANDPSVQFYRLSWIDAMTTKKTATAKDFVSGYAQSDPYEDFAESFVFFALHRNQFKAIARRSPILQAKYDFMDTVVFADTPFIAEGKSTGKNIPWDVTKLPYEWRTKHET